MSILTNLLSRFSKSDHSQSRATVDLENAKLMYSLKTHQIELEMQNEELRKAQSDLQKAFDRYKFLYNNSPSGFISLDSANTIKAINSAALETLHRSEIEVTHQPIFAFFADESKDQLYLILQDIKTCNDVKTAYLKVESANRPATWVRLDCQYSDIDQKGEIHIAMIDITQQKENQEKIWHQAHFDHLTNLPNRYLLQDRLKQVIHHARREKHGFVIFAIDLNRFKLVNDTFGHDAGDELLKIVAQRLTAHSRESDTIARLGGDEFIAILTNLSDEEDCERIANAILDSLAQPYTLADQTISFVRASIGIARYPEDTTQAKQLMKFSDMALYQAKNSEETGGYRLFTPVIQHEFSEKIGIELDLRNAILSLDQFDIYYQPIINLKSNKIERAEALIRWIHPKHGIILPDFFLPIVEDMGMMPTLGHYVLGIVTQQAKNWIERKLPIESLSVNVSSSQCKKGLNSVLQKLIETYRIPSKRLKLEITESIMLTPTQDTLTQMEGIHNMGVQLSLDDFGTGHSSLIQMKYFPIDEIKIDRLFMENIPSSKKDILLCRALISLAKHFKKDIVVEGIESKAQLDFARQYKCNYGQGFYFSKPLAAESFEKLISPSTQLSV